MMEPVWELHVAQRGSSRRFIAACFNPQNVLLQMADVIEFREGNDFIKMEEHLRCDIETTPDALWKFFKSKADAAQNPFLFNENVHLNIRKPGKPVEAYCLYVKNDQELNLEMFRAFFKKAISSC
jgi:hypothetical protein